MDSLPNRTIEKRFGAVSNGTPQTVSGAGDTLVHSPASGKALRVKWLGLSSPPENTATTVVTVKLSGNPIYIWAMGAPGAFAHSFVREGDVNGTLVVNLSAAQTVYVNFDLEEF